MIMGFLHQALVQGSILQHNTSWHLLYSMLGISRIIN
jgi:hypothetical protein